MPQVKSAMSHIAPTSKSAKQKANILLLKEAAIVRGNEMILRDVSIQIPATGKLWLRGDNGTGKSSLLRAIAGFIPLASGALTLDGHSYKPDNNTDLPVQFLGHDNGLNPVLTGRQNLYHAAQLVGVDLSKSDVLIQDSFAITSFVDRPVRTLSAGQRQRISLSRLYFGQRGALWLLDEPDTALDAESRKMLYMLIDEHCAAGGRVIMATHRAPDTQDSWTIFDCVRATP